MFVSIRGRVLLNVEALNMTESVGNYVKHRRVPVILPSNGYTTIFVPAISGESIAHGFQLVLAEIAREKNLPVCKLCEKGIFLKSTNNSVFSAAFGEDAPSNDFEFEKKVLNKCVVEDVGGFLYAERMNVKRTSNFFTGYMIPVKETLENVVIEPQLHSRYALGTPFVQHRGQQRGQMIYYVELSSAVYTFSFDFDSKFIGKATFSYQHAGEEVVTNKKQRIETALESIKKFLIEFCFGAKKTRFMPVIEWESLVIAVSGDTWTVPSPFSKNYVENAKKKLEKVNYKTKLFIYPEQGSFEEVISDAIDDAKKRI